MLHAMIMAGGGGTRFWPRSRTRRPKQFLSLGADRTLLQLARDRMEAQVPPERTWVITSAAHREETIHQLPDVPPEHIVGEPCGRDTAAAVGLGAALIAREDPSAVMLVTPADHVIEPVQEFRRALHTAERCAEDNPDALITFGIPPTYPATGYGYIHRGAEATGWQGVAVYAVRGFKEKPPLDEAKAFLKDGGYFWNSGIFVWKVSAIFAELRRQQPALVTALSKIVEAWSGPDRETVLKREYEALKKISIDKAVMEHAAKVLTVQAPYRWDDVGSWLAMERMNPQDGDGNTVRATHTGIRTSKCVIVGDPGKLITTIGVKNLLIIQDGDAILIADKGDEGTVKDLVDLLKDRGLEKYL